MNICSPRWFALGMGALLGLVASSAQAFPGFFVGKNATPRVSHATFVVVMNRGEQSAVSVMPDYDGPYEPFAIVLAVPGDVTLDRISTLRREYVDRVDQISAPRFHEFWEMDPCEPGKVLQEWERDLRVTGEDNFLGSGADIGPTRRVPKELLLNMKVEEKAGEYTFSVPAEEQTFIDYTKSRGWVLTPKMEQAITRYEGTGVRFVLGEIDHNRLELIGGERSQLSPIRFWTDHRYTKIPVRLGRMAAKGAQELFVLVLDAEKRFTTTNYPVAYPPTNIEVEYIAKEPTGEFYVKERMGELFGALHDRWLAKHPTTFWLEYAWSADGCGQPCPNDPLLINEILTLGGEIFERGVPEEERNPKPPKMTDDEKRQMQIELEGHPPQERPKYKKMMEEDRKELYRRRGVLDRQHYVLTRLHHRYEDAGIPHDVEIGPTDQGLVGGIELPKGKTGDLPMDVKEAKETRMQTRFVNFHPWKGMQSCENPERWRWGKPPRSYRGLRKIWVVEDIVRKSRTQITPERVVRDRIDSLGLTGEPPKPVVDAGVGDTAAQKGRGCGCRVEASTDSGLGTLLLTFIAGWAASIRRRRRA